MTDDGMQFLGEIDGRRCYWAAPGGLQIPGLHVGDGEQRRHVSLPPEPPKWEKFDEARAYSDEDLTYAAYARCKCGAGMAYPKNTGPAGFWACSELLKLGEKGSILFGKNPLQSEAEGLDHSLALPFTFFEVKSEKQPSANGATTRQKVAA